MVSADEIEKEVFELVEHYNGFWIWLLKRYPLKVETDLNKDFRMAPEDAYELLEKYVEKFNINPKDIEFERFFPDNNRVEHVPLTIGMLIESAKAGRWLY